MSKTNTSLQGPATDDQVGHIKSLIDKQLRSLTNGQAQAIIINGDVYQCHHQQTLDEVLVAVTNTIIRKVKVNRTRSPKEMLDATKRTQYTTNSVVKIIPKGEGEETTVEFFKLSKYVSDNDLDLEYQKRGLIPDPYAQAAVNEADPAFADEHPIILTGKTKTATGASSLSAGAAASAAST